MRDSGGVNSDPITICCAQTCQRVPVFTEWPRPSNSHFFLFGTHQLPRGVAIIGLGKLLQRRGDVALAFQYLSQLERPVARGDPRFGQEYRRQVPRLILAPARVGDGHPFAMRALGRRFARAPFALAFIVIFGAAFPDVVRELMIVPLRDHREQLVQPLQIGIAAIGGIAQAVIGERDNLLRRLDIAAGQRVLQRRIVADLIFVQIIADVRDEVDVVPRRGMGIGVEPAERQVRAGEKRDREGAGRASGQRAGAPVTDFVPSGATKR